MYKDLDIGSTPASLPLLLLHIWINVYQTLAKEIELKKLLYFLCFHIRKEEGQITHESI